jgi:hypothetical protein
VSFFVDFDDEFFFRVALVCALLVFVDWAIGPTGRAAMREKTAEWWIHIQDTTFVGLVAADAAKIRRFFLNVFGKKWYSMRRMTSTSVLSVLLTLFLASVFVDANEFHATWASVLFALLLPNAICDWMSLNITIFFAVKDGAICFYSAAVNVASS